MTVVLYYTEQAGQCFCNVLAQETLLMNRLKPGAFAALLGCSLALGHQPLSVQAAPEVLWIAQATVEIDDFRLEPVDSISPGNELVFTLEGTPGAKATYTIVGVGKNRPMREVEPGVYEGRYTVRSKDKLTTRTIVRANLQKGKLLDSVRLSRSLVATGPATSSSTTATAGATTIQRFSADPVERLEPGTELVFRLVGTPRAKATFTIAGVTRSQPMDEVSEGNYEGRYTVRRQDNFPPGIAITGALQVGTRTASVRLGNTLVNDSAPPVVRNLTPANGVTVPPGRPQISGLFEDAQGSGTDPRSVRIRFDGRDVTEEATITANFFNYQPPRPLAQGEHQVVVDLKDGAGNPGNSTWAFFVGQGGAVPDPFKIEVLSPANNSQVPSGPVTVRGRTAVGAAVQVSVQANTSLAGFLGINQTILDRTVQADSQGNFSVQFQSQVFASPGTRYEVNLTARKDNQTKQQQLVLIQK